MRVTQISLAVAQNISIERMNLAACRGQHRMTRSDIPLHGAPQAWIEVSLSLCDQTNLER